MASNEQTAPVARERALDAFKAQFGGEPDGIALGPGRVNIIGEHTDYTGGFVLPMAVDKSVAIAYRKKDGTDATVHSADYDESKTFAIANPERIEGHHWANYIMGVASVTRRAGHRVSAMEAAVAGDVPQGAGLSSSAAVEVATMVALDDVSGIGLDGLTHVRLAQRAENEFVGVNCGIMDQFVSRLGERDHCLRIDCRDLQYTKVPLKSSDVSIVVCDTGVKRKLSAGEYNARRSACESAADKLTGTAGALLRDVPLTRLLESKKDLTDEEYRRALHVLRENERVGLCCAALAEGRYEEAGKLMCDSHESLRDLFEVSCKELDAMVEIAMSVDGVYGSRLTGAGFGGCTVSLVKSGAEGALIDAVMSTYQGKTGLEPRVFVFDPGEGAHIDRP
jgi:galactokinase